LAPFFSLLPSQTASAQVALFVDKMTQIDL
jgi:hypothetical protein